MEKFEVNKTNKVVRGANRATYDKETVFNILDDGFICHLGFVIEGKPFIIPTAYARKGDIIYVHGSVKSRAMKTSKDENQVCVSVTHTDGLVLARSAFHHSVNYRSVIIYGNAVELTNDEEKIEALKLITESVLKGRWQEVRPPSQKELDITSVLEIKIESASAKIRTGDPMDDKEDYELDVWAGVLPIEKKLEAPISDEKLRDGIPVSESVQLAWENSKA